MSESDIAKEGRVLSLWGSPAFFTVSNGFQTVTVMGLPHGLGCSVSCIELPEQNIPGVPREWMGVSVSIRVQLSDCSY